MKYNLSVCVCTFRRNVLLQRTLESLAVQEVTPCFTYELIIVDNDDHCSARALVDNFRERCRVRVQYHAQPIRNISLARNTAMRAAGGDLIVFIDDDERACCDWLLQLIRTFDTYKPEGVFGPVLPEFEADCGSWVKEGGFFCRGRLKTGETVPERHYRTGNVLFRRSVVLKEGAWFDPEYGRTGGEDWEFFYRRKQRGAQFVWCDDAKVYEYVSAERCTASYLTGRAFRNGYARGKIMRKHRLWAVTRCVENLAVLAAVTPLSVMYPMFATSLRIKLIGRLFYSAGMLAGYAGVPFKRYIELL